MKKSLAISLVAVLSVFIFGLGVYASESEWISFESKVEVTERNVEEIMKILRKVNSDKITAEEALEAFEGIDVDELEREINDLKNKLDNKQIELNNKQKELDNKQIEIQNKIDEIDKKNNEINEKANKINSMQDYINHLESELTKANAKVSNLNQSTDDAVKEARGFVDQK